MKNLKNIQLIEGKDLSKILGGTGSEIIIWPAKVMKSLPQFGKLATNIIDDPWGLVKSTVNTKG